MNRDETAERFLKGREAWNAWAEGLEAPCLRLDQS